MSAAKTQQRISFSTVKNRVPYPDLLEVQLKSFRDFFQMDTTAENRKNEGLYKKAIEQLQVNLKDREGELEAVYRGMKISK